MRISDDGTLALSPDSVQNSYNNNNFKFSTHAPGQSPDMNAGKSSGKRGMAWVTWPLISGQ